VSGSAATRAVQWFAGKILVQFAQKQPSKINKAKLAEQSVRYCRYCGEQFRLEAEQIGAYAAQWFLKKKKEGERALSRKGKRNYDQKNPSQNWSGN
jgi:hypothetical protein